MPMADVIIGRPAIIIVGVDGIRLVASLIVCPALVVPGCREYMQS